MCSSSVLSVALVSLDWVFVYSSARYNMQARSFQETKNNIAHKINRANNMSRKHRWRSPPTDRVGLSLFRKNSCLNNVVKNLTSVGTYTTHLAACFFIFLLHFTYMRHVVEVPLSALIQGNIRNSKLWGPVSPRIPLRLCLLSNHSKTTWQCLATMINGHKGWMCFFLSPLLFWRSVTSCSIRAILPYAKASFLQRRFSFSPERPLSRGYFCSPVCLAIKYINGSSEKK